MASDEGSLFDGVSSMSKRRAQARSARRSRDPIRPMSRRKRDSESMRRGS